MKKQPDITAATKKNLIDSFWSLYEKKDIKEIHIKELTDLAGYHRATFYQYFTDIYDLFAQEQNELISKIEKIRGKTPDIEQASTDVLKQIAKFYINNGKHIVLLTGSGGDPSFLEKLKEVIYRDFKLFEGIPNCPSSSVIFEFGISGLLMAFNCWYSYRDELDIEDFIKTARSLIENGIPKTLGALFMENE